MLSDRGRQKGAATLLGTVIVLGLMTLIVFFANRNVLFERKTSANQYRSVRAIEAAEAGVEWTLANLNAARKITNACATSAVATDRQFRDVYLDPDANGSFKEAFATSMPVCTLIGGAWSCSCPANGNAATVASCSAPEGCPTFRVEFANVAADATMVRVRVVGCTNSQQPCVPSASTADGTATITQVIKALSGLSSLPAAAITAKQNVDFGSNAITASNTDPGTNGITINAGGSITGFLNDSTLHTLPGTPPTSSLVGNDGSLAALTDDQMFMTYFGMTKDQFKTQASTTVVNCGGVCNAQMTAAVDGGARTIWVEGDMTLNANGVYGSPTSPVVMVINGNVELRGTMTIYGVVYCQNGVWDNTGGGNAQVIGAAIAEGSFTATGTPDPTYDPNVLRRLRETTGDFAKVPGAWRDF